MSVGGTSPDRTMHLSRHDLAHLDEAHLAGLAEGSLRVLSVRLLADLKEAVERAGRNPSSSSRPPSSRAPWEGGAGEAGQETAGQSAKASAAGDTRETAPPARREAPERPSPKQGGPRRPGRRPGSSGERIRKFVEKPFSENAKGVTWAEPEWH
jgi:transposase